MSYFGTIPKALECSPVYLLGLTDDIHFDAHAEESRHKVLIGKYDALDALGRRAVDAVLDVEYERCTAKDADNIPYRPINLYTLPVSAGTGIELLAEEEPEPIYIPLTPTSRAADFVLRVQGDSMEPDYQDGDLILLRQTPDIEEGQLGVFGLDGEGFFKKLGDHTLISLNTDYPAKEL